MLLLIVVRETFLDVVFIFREGRTVSRLRSQYLEALPSPGQCVIGLTRERVRRICPHLTDSEVDTTLMRKWVVAVPPLTPSADPFLVRAYRRQDGTFILCVLPTGKREDASTTYAFWDQAIQFAKANWPEGTTG